MAVTASFLGSTLWNYPTVPGTYDLSTFITVNQDCPADAVMLVGTVVFEFGGVLPMRPGGSPPVTDDQGLFYFASGGTSINTAAGQTGATLSLDFYVANRSSILAAGQRIKLRRTTVVISSPLPSQPARSYAVDFAYVWRGASAVGTISAVGEANPGGVIAVSSGPHTVPITGAYDLIGVGAAGLWASGGIGAPAVGGVSGLTWAEGGSFVREQTFLQDFPWDQATFTSSHLDGPGVFLSKATVTRASPTSEVYTATLTDPNAPPDADQWIGAYAYGSGLAPATPGLAGVWNIHTEFGQYQKAYAKNGVLHYASVDAPLPPMTSDAGVATLPAGATDSEPRMIRDWLKRTWLVFTRTVSSAPNVYSTVSDAEGVTWSDPIMAFAGGKHGDISFDPRTGIVFRAAYVSGQIKATTTDTAGVTSALFTLVDQNGAALAPDDDVFHVTPYPDAVGRWLLVMTKGGAVVDYYSTDDLGHTWQSIP